VAPDGPVGPGAVRHTVTSGDRRRGRRRRPVHTIKAVMVATIGE
jgi:hypothetical protein